MVGVEGFEWSFSFAIVGVFWANSSVSLGLKGVLRVGVGLTVDTKTSAWVDVVARVVVPLELSWALAKPSSCWLAVAEAASSGGFSHRLVWCRGGIKRCLV